MKKLIFPALTVMLYITSCSNSSFDLVTYGLTGKVKSVSEYQFEAKFVDEEWVAGTRGKTDYLVINFDKDGVYLARFALNNKGDTVGFASCKRENGEIIEEQFIFAYTNEHTRTIQERVSKEQVNLEHWNGEVLDFEGANYYDSRGRVSRQVRVVKGVEYFIHFVYEKNLLVESYMEDGNGQRQDEQLFEYTEFDKKGNWTTKLVYIGEEQIIPDLVMNREVTYYD